MKFERTKHWLFDFDGTLVDSMGHWSACMVGLLDKYGVPHGDDIVNIITPLGSLGTARYFQKIGLDLTLEEIGKEVHEDLYKKYHDVIVAKDGVLECLTKMKARGYKLHVLTASPHTMLDPCLKRNGLFDLFENVWSSDDFGTGKSNPKIYAAVAERIGADLSDITFLDDNINADMTAKGAGVRVIGVYDETSRDDTEKMKELLDGFVYSFSELEADLID